MIFQETWERVLDGTKTQTRRPVKPGDYIIPRIAEARPDAGFAPWETGYVRRNRRHIWQTENTYAVQPGRGKKGVARIELITIRYCERAGDITPEDAIAEGFDTPAAFCDVYAALNGKDALDRACWALTFALVPAGARNTEEQS